ncbi:RNA polymerase sigma factor [Spirosoma luteum]|uniref:RNA polymerase sigma factor n=1 Tax=Spirosoma luteum TaxID=431553 RepID=UPI00036BD273|nr:sigma-70 family RNA polymerase sigma factor [Spirosoma luteum]
MTTQDQTLWQLYREGDKQALGYLVERYYRALKHYGLKFMVDEAVVEDCLQELFLQLWQNRDQINATVSVKHYLFKALRHHVLQYLRSQKRVPTQELDWDTSITEETDSETLLIQRESLSQLTNALQAQLDSLPAREREALYLRYYSDLSIPEIAEVMNVNRQSVSNFLQKAITKLRKSRLSPVLFAICIICQTIFL